jgi:hypothetical protein
MSIVGRAGRAGRDAAAAQRAFHALTRTDAVPACAQVTRIVRRTMASVAGGGASNVDGRDRYKLSGRGLTKEEEAERVRHAAANLASFGDNVAPCAEPVITCVLFSVLC